MEYEMGLGVEVERDMKCNEEWNMKWEVKFEVK